MLGRRLLLLIAILVLLMTLARRESASAGASAGGAADFDAADPPGLIVFHLHSDGRLHLHVHLLGRDLAFFLTPATPAPRAALPASALPNHPAALPAPAQRGLPALEAALLALILIVAARSPRLRPAPAPPLVECRFPPPDPPPQHG